MDIELERMLVKTINVRKVLTTTPAGNESLDVAVAMAAYVEVKTGTVKTGNDGIEKVVTHVIVTKDLVELDDRIWLPGDSPANVNLGKRPVAINTYNDPETGAVDHYEVTL